MDIKQVLKYDNWEGRIHKGMYFSIVGEMSTQDNKRVITAYKFIDNSSDPMQEISWNLELVDAQRHFFQIQVDK